jgi:acetyltransferase-like isoleucine patch superfamily enzyme
MSRRNSAKYASYLRRKGVKIGQNTEFHDNVTVDLTRPCLVEIGENCVLTTGVFILTHGYDLAVLREKYGEFLCSSGKVVIEDNVFVGINSIILKGVTIGKNSIIGAGSIVTHDIPEGSVAAGNPCKVIMTLNDYYSKRKQLYKEEAKKYALELFKKTGKVPKPQDFWEEFPLFLGRNGEWNNIPVKKQLGSTMSNFLASKPVYGSFREFLVDSGIPANRVYDSC